MLFEQGCEQFELWNKRRAPRAEMEAAVFSGVDRI
jgi:shikimate 5-dehydrogenase